MYNISIQDLRREMNRVDEELLILLNRLNIKRTDQERVMINTLMKHRVDLYRKIEEYQS